MRKTRLVRILGPVLIFLLSIFSSAELNADDQLDAAPSILFRNIFYTLAKKQYREEDIQRLVYVPDDSFLESYSLEGQDPFTARKEAWDRIAPSQLFEKGQQTAFEEVNGIDERLNYKPVTIMIVPGIFGEFIEHSPYHEVLTQKSSRFAQTWAEAIQKNPTTDEVFDLELMGKVEKNLSDIVQVASIDNAEGKELVRVIYLKPLFGSLETLGTVDESAAIYLKRIQKVREVLGGLDNLYLMGYSRGLNVALHTAKDAAEKPDQYTWYKDLKGIISLGGTLYGSPLADAAFQQGKPSCLALARLNQLAKELVTVPADANLVEKIKAVASNAGAWTRASAELVGIGMRLETPEGLSVESIPTDTMNMGAFGRLFNKVIFDKFKIIDGSEFNNNVEKFQLVMREITEGADSITKAKTIEWQRKYTLPAELKYYTLQGSMADPSTEKSGPNYLTTHAVSFNTKALDYAALRRSYYEYYGDTGSQMNDSQVSPDRTIFWPAYHQSLNPQQKPYEAKLIAVLGVDHWGMSFPVALETQDKETSPYPRSILLHAIGAFLAQDLMER